MWWLQYLAARHTLSPSSVNGSPPHFGGSLPLFPSSHVLGVAVHSIPPPCPVHWHLTNLVPTLCLSFCGCTNQGTDLPQFWRLAVPSQGVGKVGSFRSSWPRSVSASHPAYGSCWPSFASLGLQLHHSNLGLYCHMVYTLCMSLHPNFPHLLRIQVIGLGPHLDYTCKGPVSNQGHIHGC